MPCCRARNGFYPRNATQYREPTAHRYTMPTSWLFPPKSSRYHFSMGETDICRKKPTLRAFAGQSLDRECGSTRGLNLEMLLKIAKGLVQECHQISILVTFSHYTLPHPRILGCAQLCKLHADRYWNTHTQGASRHTRRVRLDTHAGYAQTHTQGASRHTHRVRLDTRSVRPDTHTAYD